jgi:hypothetical protein
MMTIDEIRAHYPDPIAAADYTTGEGYCVGGALCRSAGWSDLQEFPMSGRIAEALRILNPFLNNQQSLAYHYARAIMTLNDTRRFDDAWTLAEEALTWRPL